MTRKKIVIPALIISMFVPCAKAQTLAEAWLTAPSSLVPQMNLQQKKDALEEATVGSNSLEVAVSEARMMQLFQTKVSTGDSILCIIDTYLLPARKSMLSFYDKKWQKLTIGTEMPAFVAADFLTRPDTMSTQRFDELLSLYHFDIVGLRFDEKELMLRASLSDPVCATKEDREQIEQIRHDILLRWDGTGFKKI